MTDIEDFIRIGIDIGGTFTDFVLYSNKTNNIASFKIVSTPDNPSAAVLDGLSKIFENYPNHDTSVIHGCD